MPEEIKIINVSFSEKEHKKIAYEKIDRDLSSMADVVSMIVSEYFAKKKKR